MSKPCVYRHFDTEGVLFYVGFRGLGNDGARQGSSHEAARDRSAHLGFHTGLLCRAGTASPHDPGNHQRGALGFEKVGTSVLNHCFL